MTATILEAPSAARSFTAPIVQTLRYHGADDPDRKKLLGAASAFMIPGAYSRNDLTSGHIVKVWNTRFERILPSVEYTAFSTRKFAAVLVAESDREYDHDLIQNFPITPNWIGINKYNGHSQYIWYLASPVLGEGYTRRYFRWIAKRVTMAIDGDIKFSHHMMRNPLFEERPWEVYSSRPYEWHCQHHDFFDLIDFDERLPLFDEKLPTINGTAQARTAPDAATFSYDAEGIQRKKYLFDVARLAAYAMRGRGEDADANELLALLIETNTWLGTQDSRPPQNDSWLRSNANKIASWTNSHLEPGGRGGSQITLWTRQQQVAGGRTQGARNVESGHMARIQEIGSMANRLNAIEHYAQIREFMELTGLSVRKTASELGISKSTVERAIKDAR